MTNLLELKGISKTFPGVKALSDVDLDLRPGEVLGLCGENGAGKSTLMKVLTGIHKSDPGGEIWLQGEQVDIQSPEHARDLGLSIIHQELNIVPDLTVAQNLYLGRQESSKWMYVDDRKLVRLMWVYDVNFSWTLRRVKERGYIEDIIAHLPEEPRMALGIERLLAYVEKKCAEEDEGLSPK